MPQTVVVGFDGTEGARAALEEAIALASASALPLVAVFVYDKVVVGGESKDLDEAVMGRARELLNDASDRVAQAGLAFESELIEGQAAPTIADAAERHDARWVVVGSFGERPLHALLVGAVPTKLMYLSDRPIVVVRAADQG